LLTSTVTLSSVRVAAVVPAPTRLTLESVNCLNLDRSPQDCGKHTGYVLTVWKLDRLGRNTQHVLAVVDELTARGVGFRSLTEGLHTDGRWARPC
jgi:Resolvase, N terminal domain